MFKFLGPRLRDDSIHPTIGLLTKGVLRTLLVLFHDFPEYLSENYFTLSNLIPPFCVQLKNLILSAFPRTTRLPDPFVPGGLKLETIPELKDSPILTVNIAALLDAVKIRAPLNKYLQTRAPEDLPKKLVERMKAVPMENGMQNGNGPTKPKYPHYNVELLSAVVLYIGMQAIEIAQKNEETGLLIFNAKSPHMALFTALTAEFDAEGFSPPVLLKFRLLLSNFRDGESTPLSK